MKKWSLFLTNIWNFYFSDQQPHAWSKALPLGQTDGCLLCYCGGKGCAYRQYIHAGMKVLYTLNLFDLVR